MNETLIKSNINVLEEWTSGDQLDFIVLLGQYNAEIKSGAPSSRRFWGWSSWTNVGGCDSGWQTVIKKHYILGIRDSIEYNEIRC